MLAKISYELSLFIANAKHNLPSIAVILAILWIVNIINWLCGSMLLMLGIVPRNPLRMIGILFSPIIHKDLNHLFFNSIPLFALGLFMLSFGDQVFYTATILISLISGFAVWLIGRNGNHIGASGLIMGYFGFMLSLAYQQPSITSLFLAVVALYYFGGLLFSIFPSCEKVSWEGHLLGFIAGIITVRLV